VRRGLQRTVVHCGGQAALATNRPTDAVGNSSQGLRIAKSRPQIVRKNPSLWVAPKYFAVFSINTASATDKFMAPAIIETQPAVMPSSSVAQASR
jgi:hypothetical protein